jgi:hypothetical protein
MSTRSCSYSEGPEEVEFPIVDPAVTPGEFVLGLAAPIPAADDGVVTGADGSGVNAIGGGLRPPAPSSVDPNGIPTRPTGATVIPVGDEAEAAGCEEVVLPVVAQVPDAVPGVPPPSKGAFEPLVIAQGEPPPVTEPGRELPNGAGLTPGVVSSVAPSGMPAAPTGEPGPMPSGEVVPSGDVEGMSPPCASAGPQSRESTQITIIVDLINIIICSSGLVLSDNGLRRSEALAK